MNTMECLYKSRDSEIWVYAKPGVNVGTLKEKLTSPNLLMISDLDRTDSPSNTPMSIYQAIKGVEGIDKNVLWGIIAIPCIILKGEDFINRHREFLIKTFIRKPNVEKSLMGNYTLEYAISRLYNGVLEFYSILPPTTRKIYVTGAVREVTEPFKLAAGFDEAYPEQINKVRTIELICNHYHDAIILYKDDDPKSIAILELLRHMESRGKIQGFTSIFVASSLKRMNPEFDFNIPRHYGGLVELLRDRK